MNDRLLGLVRIAFGLVVLAAIATMIVTLVSEGVFSPLNFFTFFTVLSNLFATAIFMVGGQRQLAGQEPLSGMWRGAAVVYMAVTYIVFAVLLRDLQEQLQTHVPWVDSVLHRVMPIAVMLDWAIAPPGERIPFRRASVWLAFPLAWTAFTLVRGAIDGRYPYPFLDPENGGYGVVALYCAAIFALFVAVTWSTARIGSIRRSTRGETATAC